MRAKEQASALATGRSPSFRDPWLCVPISQWVCPFSVPPSSIVHGHVACFTATLPCHYTGCLGGCVAIASETSIYRPIVLRSGLVSAPHGRTFWDQHLSRQCWWCRAGHRLSAWCSSTTRRSCKIGTASYGSRSIPFSAVSSRGSHGKMRSFRGSGLSCARKKPLDELGNPEHHPAHMVTGPPCPDEQPILGEKHLSASRPTGA